MKSALTAAALLVAWVPSAGALDYRTTSRPALLHDAPSTAAGRVAVAGSGVPLEVIVDTQAWLKVRDADGRLSWIEAAALGGPRNVMIKAESSTIRQQPRADAAVVFRAARGVLLEATGDVDAFGWIPVRHADGLAGWLPAHEAWGR